VTTASLIFFYSCALVAILGALVTVIAKNPIRGAMGLMCTILAVAGVFLALHAHFLAAIQLIVYAGAIVVLFIFVIMLLGPSATSSRDQRGRVTRTFGGVLFALVSLAAIYLVVRPAWNHAYKLVDYPADYGTIDAMGRVLFTEYVVPFELSSALLMIAIVAAVAVARGKHKSDNPQLADSAKEAAE
jgi:NADH-quinone oxidoreductase subunit J